MNWTFLTITIWHSIWPLLSATGVLRADIPRTAFLAATCVPDTDTAATAAATTLRRHTTRRRMADRTIQREERRPAISFFFSGATSATLNILFSTLIVLKTDSHTWFWRRTWEGAALERHGDWVLYRRWEWEYAGDGSSSGAFSGRFTTGRLWFWDCFLSFSFPFFCSDSMASSAQRFLCFMYLFSKSDGES